MAKATAGAPKGALGGLSDSSGDVGFQPWPAGQYALQVSEAQDTSEGGGRDLPQKNPERYEYMAILKFSIIAAPDNDYEGRTPLGSSITSAFLVPTGEFEDSDKAWRTRSLNEIKNVCDAFGVKLRDDWFASAKGIKDFVGKKAAVNLAIYKKKSTGSNEQAWNGFLALADSEWVDDIE